MPKADVTFRWADGDILSITVESDLDELADVLGAALKGYAEATGSA